MGTRGGWTGVVVAACVSLCAPSAGAGGGPTLELDPDSGPAGAVIEVHGSGVPGGNLVVLYLDAVGDGAHLATTTASAGGAYSTSFAVPAGTPAGDHGVVGCFGRTMASLTCSQMRHPPRVTPGQGTTPTTLGPGSSTTATTLGLGSSPTSPTTTSTEPVEGVSPTTTLGGPSGLGATPTTVRGYPPFEGDQLPLGTSTTLKLPGSLQGDNAESIPNLAIADVEVTQGLQNLANDFPMVKHRSTTVRIHGTSESQGAAGQTGVMAAVEGVRGGQSLGIVYAENAPVHWDGDLHRSSHDHVPYVRIPTTWAAGTLTLRAWVWAVDPTAQNEPITSANLAEVTLEFHQASNLPHLWYFPLYLNEGWDPEAPPAIHTLADGYLVQHLHAARLLPVPAMPLHPQTTVFGFPWTGWNLNPDEGDPGAPLAALAELHELNGAGATRPLRRHGRSQPRHELVRRPRLGERASGVGEDA